jgi:dihydroorotase-like cyclic amidohydrolase
MVERADIVLSGGVIAAHEGTEASDIAVAMRRITAIGGLTGLPAARVIDCRGLTVLPVSSTPTCTSANRV